jgi:ureidoglycolate hydrolase
VDRNPQKYVHLENIDANNLLWFNEFIMLAQTDLDEIEKIVDEKITEKTRNLPTKDEFFEETLKVLKKLDNLQEAMDIVSARQSTHSDQIEALEKIHPLGSHTALV